MRFWLVFLFPLLTSCVSYSTLFHGIDESTASCEQISGKYLNDPDENAGPLAYRLHNMKRKVHSQEVVAGVDVIELTYDGAELLKVDFWNNDSLVDAFSLKVKPEENHLEIKRKLRLVPIPLLFWLHDERRCVIMNDTDGNLVIGHGSFQALIFLTFARGANTHGTADFDRVTE
ncbi:MAG: hypothetical protein A3D92_15410 [Bacteroidetes bacterium RIFCSPHIGHO2_02_FULL_44_7]|nr:MAG: hypothetical protein A3D92_15410 [Bacteroidetes bacterium RIFCSPHIGHO2_02_FULL_44_7]